MTAVIEATGLVKTFGQTRALDGLDLRLEAGQIHGFLGPNGAGKSTTIRVLLGLLRRTSGVARVFGMDPFIDSVAIHRRLGYVPGDVVLWPNLSGGECLDLLLSMSGGFDAARRDALVERFELDPTKRGRSYSKGNRQKVALVAALATDAELLILDEPTSGLDPLMEKVFQDELAAARARGCSVLLSSHILSEVERACDTISIVRAGRVVESGSLADLRHLRRSHVEVTLREPVTLQTAAGWSGVHDPVLSGAELHCTVEPDAIGAFLAAVEPFGVERFVCQPPSLEELFLARYDAR